MTSSQYLTEFFEWIFGKKHWRYQIKEVRNLRNSIKPEARLFNSLWSTYKEKSKIVKAIREGKRYDQIKLYYLNRRLQTIFKNLLKLASFDEALIKKILYESSERLHEAEAWIWRYNSINPAASELYDGSISIPKGKGKRMPYNIDHSKQAIWKIISKDEELENFVQQAAEAFGTEFKKLKELFRVLNEKLSNQTKKLRNNIEAILEEFNEENILWAEVRKTLSNILNKILLLARKVTLLELDEIKIEEQLKSKESKTLGVMLIHGYFSLPSDMLELEAALRNQGYITYNVRLPGHETSEKEFFNVHMEEIKHFVLSAFKYFYQYMYGLNKGNGRFYVIGFSAGAMVTLHLMAKSWSKYPYKYPYQAMIKGIVSISSGLFFYPLLRGHSIEPLEKTISNILSKAHYTQDLSSLDKNVRKLRKIYVDDKEFEAAFREEAERFVRETYRNLRKKFQEIGSIFITEQEEKEGIQETVGQIMENIKQGKRAFPRGSSLDPKVTAKRHIVECLSFRSLGELMKLGIQLREDVRKVRVPILIFHGKLDTIDHPRSAEYIYNNVGSDIKKLIILKRSGHNPVVDFDQEILIRESVKFIHKAEEEWQKYEKVNQFSN